MKRDWKEGQENGLERRTGKGNREKDGNRDRREGQE